MVKRFFACAVLCIALSPLALAAPLSRGIDILRTKTSYTIAVESAKTYTFSKEDFVSCIGCSFDKIVIKTLPDNGILKFGVDEVEKGAVISKSEIGALRFIPYESASEDAAFTFNVHENSTDSDYTLRLCTDRNSAPTAHPAEFETFRAVAVFNSLSGEDDAEGFSYHAVSAPENGTLTLRADGSFVYTPKTNFVGKDSFEFCIKDSHGALSDTQKVEIRVRRPWRNLCFSDMVNSPSHAAAIKLCASGIEKITVNSEGKPVFMGEDALSRAEFVLWVMKAQGISLPESGDIEEVFLDADSVSPEHRAAVSYAIKLGYIKGREANGASVIEPDSQITLAEAKTVIARVTLAEDDTDALFASDEYSHPLTRAEGAELVFQLLTGK